MPTVAVDLSSRLAEIFSGRRRVAPTTTLLIASLVTALVAVPLLIRALDDDSAARLGDVADAERLTVAVEGVDEPIQLDGATLAGAVGIVYDDADVDAASFALFVEGADSPVLASQDLDGPTFSPVVDPDGVDQPLDTTLLANGEYELFVVVLRGDVEQRTVASFQVENP